MTALDKSLDELITEKRYQSTRGGGYGTRDRDGMNRRDRMERLDRAPVRDPPLRREPYDDVRPVRHNDPPRMEYDTEVRAPRAPVSAPPEGRVRVDGLDPAWEAKDVREIFSEQGHIILRVYMHWDRSGRSQGSCEMSLDSVAHARALVDDMDGAEVDGFPLRISLARAPPPGAAPPAPAGPPASTRGREPYARDPPPRDAPRDAPFGGGGRAPPRDEGPGGKGRNRDRALPTKEELDAELERMRRDR